MSYPVVPAIIPRNKEELLTFVAESSFVNEIQIDVVDGVFVPATSWPYEPAGEPVSIKHATDPFTLEIDLMVEKPLQAAEAWLKAGADMLVFHVESIALEIFERYAEKCPASVGVACHGNTSLETLFKYAELADYVQLMGIAEIGAQSQPFDRSVLEKIEIVRRNFPDLMISIDGSVNEQTIVDLKKAGATRFVSGSAIVGSEAPEEAYKKLLALVN